MAARIPIEIENEMPQTINESVIRIGRYLSRYRKVRDMKEGGQIVVFLKNVEFAPSSWCQLGDVFVVVIGPYQLGEDWGPWGEGADLDCHFDEDGNLRKAYCRL